MPKCEINKDALQRLCGTASGTTIFKEQCLVNASIFYSYFKFVYFLSLSLTTATLTKAIQDPSSVRLFSNIVSLTEGGWEGEVGSARGILLVFQMW